MIPVKVLAVKYLPGASPALAEGLGADVAYGEDTWDRGTSGLVSYDVAVAVLMVELSKDDRVGVAAKDIRCVEHFITSVDIILSRATSSVKVSP